MLRNYLWRQRLKFEATLAFSMLEPWEKVLSSEYLYIKHQTMLSSCESPPYRISYGKFAVVIFTFFTLLLASGLYQYLPQHVSIMRQRATYYLWGQDGDDRLLRHLVDTSTLKEL